MSSTIADVLETKTSIPRNKELGKSPRILETEHIADELVQRLASPAHRPLFLRVAWRLDRDTINRHVTTALELGKNPRAYFICLVKQDPRYCQ